ncbi:hypothetical protein KAI87_11755, partial [Myxococcota bacterium]|nr:hypothetical protein [Myxococcota bacterium]
MTRYWPLVLILTTIFTGIFTASCGAGSMDFHGALPQQSELRPDNPTSTEMFRFESDETVEFLDSAGGEFRIHYTRSGTNAVPDTDADTSGVPDYVELVANTYDEVLDYYQNTLGLRRPLGDAALADNGGDGRFDVYLIDFGASSDGAFRTEACLDGERERCLGFMVQENDFVNYGYSSLEEATRVLGSHEFFHAVQAAYDSDNDLERSYGVISEGTAVWATENFDPSLDDFEHLIPGYMDATDRPLGTPPNMGFSYGSAILFKFLEERFNDPTIIRKIWEKMENGVDGIADPDWLEILPPLLQNEYAVTFDEVMVDFAIWNLYTLRRADPSVSYENGAAYASVAYESVKTPVALEQERFYYSATRYFSVSILDRDKIGAALVGDPEELEDMHLIL